MDNSESKKIKSYLNILGNISIIVVVCAISWMATSAVLGFDPTSPQLKGGQPQSGMRFMN